MQIEIAYIYELADILTQTDMIKELFEIEAKQKNTFLIYLGLTLISFLQIYIFKKTIIEGNSLVIIGLSLALSLCWTILNIFPLTIIISGLKGKAELIYENIIFGSGIAIIAGQIILTYIGYKNHLSFENFIDFVWQQTLIAYLVIFLISAIFGIAKINKEKK